MNAWWGFLLQIRFIMENFTLQSRAEDHFACTQMVEKAFGEEIVPVKNLAGRVLN